MSDRNRDLGAEPVLNSSGILVPNENHELLEEGGYVVGRRDQIRFATNRRDAELPEHRTEIRRRSAK